MFGTLVFTFLLLIASSVQNTLEESSQLEKWFDNVKSPFNSCVNTNNYDVSEQNPLISVVSCEEKDAIFKYDYKVRFCHLRYLHISYVIEVYF